MNVPLIDKIHLYNGIVYIRCAGRIGKYPGFMFRGYSEEQIDSLVRNSVMWFYAALYRNADDESLYNAVDSSIEKFSGINRENVEILNPRYDSFLIHTINVKENYIENSFNSYELSSTRSETREFLKKDASILQLLRELGVDTSWSFVRSSALFLQYYDFRFNILYDAFYEELTSLITLFYRRKGQVTVYPEVIYKFIESYCEASDINSNVNKQIRAFSIHKGNHMKSENMYIRRTRNFISLLHSCISGADTSKVFKSGKNLYMLTGNTVIRFSDNEIKESHYYEMVRYLYSTGRIELEQMFNLISRSGMFMTYLSRIEPISFSSQLKVYKSQFTPLVVRGKFTDRKGKILGRKFSIERSYKCLDVFMDNQKLVTVTDYAFSLDTFFRAIEIYLEIKIIN